MKKVKMFISAAIIFAVVGSALAFKAKSNPNLFTCPAGVCVAAPYSDFFTSSGEIPNPGTIYKGPANSSCLGANPPCKLYNGRVWNND